MKILSKPVLILINVALAAIVGAFGYNYKHKASVAADYTEGLFGGFTRQVMEKNNSYGNICTIIAILFIVFAVIGIYLYSKRNISSNESNQSQK